MQLQHLVHKQGDRQLLTRQGRIPLMPKPRDQFPLSFMAAVGRDANANDAIEQGLKDAEAVLAADKARVQANYNQLWNDAWAQSAAVTQRNRPQTYGDAVLTAMTSGLREPNADPDKEKLGDAKSYKLQGVESDLMKIKKKIAGRAEYGEGLADGTLLRWRMISEFTNPHAVYDLNKPRAGPLAEAPTALELGKLVPDTIHYRKLRHGTLTMTGKAKGVNWPLDDPTELGAHPFIYNHDAGWLKINRAEFMKARTPATLEALTKQDGIPRSIDTLVGLDITRRPKEANRSNISVKPRATVIDNTIRRIPRMITWQDPPPTPVPALDQAVTDDLAAKKAAADRADRKIAADLAAKKAAADRADTNKALAEGLSWMGFDPDTIFDEPQRPQKVLTDNIDSDDEGEIALPERKSIADVLKSLPSSPSKTLKPSPSKTLKSTPKKKGSVRK